MANGRHWGVRSIASLLIFVIAAVLTPVALVGNWGHRTVADTQTYLDTVGPLAANPAIQAAVAQKVTDVVTQQVDTESLVKGFIGNFIQDPGIADKLSAPVAAGVNSLIENLVQRFIASDAFQEVWIGLNKAAQKSLVALLSGKNEGPIQTRGDAIVLDISSLLTAVQTQLVDAGVSVAANVTIPESDKSIVLVESPLIGTLQTIYAFTAPILAYFPLAIAILFALAIALARNRPRTVLATGIAVIVSAVVLGLSLRTMHELVTAHYRGSMLASALDAFWETFFTNLVSGVWALALLGLFIGLAGWYAGRSRPATELREKVCTGLHSFGTIGSSELNTWVRSYAPILRWAVGVLLTLILVLGSGLDPWRVFWLSALAAGLFTLIEVFNAPDREVVVEEITIEVSSG